MSMYLPNSGLRPTGAEAAEFIDVPLGPGADEGAAASGSAFGPAPGAASGSAPGSASVPVPGLPGRLDVQTRTNITRWAEEYISGLVDNHNGTPDDVRTIIHQLHDQQIAVDDLR